MSALREGARTGARLLRLFPWTLRLLWASHAAATVGLSLLTLLQAIIPALQLWITKLLVEQIVLVIDLPVAARAGEATQRALLYVGLEAVMLLLGVAIAIAAGHVRNVLQEHLLLHVQGLVLHKSGHLDLAAYESAAFYDQLHRAQEQATYGPVQLLDALLSFAQASLTLLSMAALIWLYQPWVLPLLMLTTLPSFGAMMYYGQKRFVVYGERTAAWRRAEYLSTILQSDAFAKEVRVWGLAEHLLARFRHLRERFLAENIGLSRGQSIASLGGEALSTGGYYVAYLSMVLAVLAGRLTLGDLTLYASAFNRVQSLFDQGLQSIVAMYEIQLFAEYLAALLSLEPEVLAPTAPQAPPALTQGLEIQNLSFRYPGTAEPVLRGVNLTIRPGECVALVGVNGSGKTSLVKCILRLYDPDEGAVRADGVDLRALDPMAWRRQIAVIFQDYARYHLSAQENIGFGNLAKVDDLAAIDAAAQQAGIATVLRALPDRYETLLGRRFEGGVELSGGQWQSVALARALMRDAPLLILDEPTSAIDAEAESALYQQFARLAQSRMTLLISHRFSTVRMADRILVLEEGHIIEEGTHEDLLARQGRYAHLYQLQAESYHLASATDRGGVAPAGERLPVAAEP